jgi:hypothetical protein
MQFPLHVLNPGIVFLLLGLLGARYAARRQARKRADLLKAVPKRPLGLDD